MLSFVDELPHGADIDNAHCNGHGRLDVAARGSFHRLGVPIAVYSKCPEYWATPPPPKSSGALLI